VGGGCSLGIDGPVLSILSIPAVLASSLSATTRVLRYNTGCHVVTLSLVPVPPGTIMDLLTVWRSYEQPGLCVDCSTGSRLANVEPFGREGPFRHSSKPTSWNVGPGLTFKRA
jgi:hypothetical protein